MAIKWAQLVVIVFILIITLLVWGILLSNIWTAPAPTGTEGYVPDASLLLGAGTVLTALGTATAAALGFGVSDVKKKQQDNNNTVLGAKETAKTIGLPAIAGLAVYALLGIAILLTAWLPGSPGGFEAMQVFALSIIGWVVGAFALIK